MIVIGLTSGMRSEAERKFAGGFRAWMVQARKGSWKNWAELIRHYPDASRTEEDEAHFPLAADGSGIRATVCFDPGLLRLLRIAPAPKAAAAVASRQQVPLSYP